MNRSKRSKRNVSSKSVADEWKTGEEVFKTFSSPTKRKISRRDTKMSLKKASEEVSPKPDRRKSILLKRIKSDFTDTSDIDLLSKRRTRQQSLANIQKPENKMVKTQIPRAKSEKTITKKKTSTAVLVSPRVKIKRLKIAVEERESEHSEVNKKSLSKTIETVSISKTSFYSRSPLKTRQTRRQSMVKMSEYNSLSNLKSTKISRTEGKQKTKSECSVSPSKEKSYPLKRKMKEEFEVTRKSPDKSQDKSPERKLSQNNKITGKKIKKTKTPLRKPVKRLSNLTPSPSPLKTKRLTRSSTKKRVKILAESPSENNDYRKTPKAGNHILNRAVKSPLKTVKPSGVILKPYTPKPEEPLMILKQTLKRNVDTEIRNSLQTNVSDFIQPSIVSVRKPLKSAALSPSDSYSKDRMSPKRSLTTETSVKNGIHHHHQQDESYSRSFQMPSTPVSSRKSVSFRRFRGSVRLTEEESLKNDDESSSPTSWRNPFNSTPKVYRTSNENDVSDEHETSVDFGEDSCAHEESKCSESSSFTTHDGSYKHNIEKTVEVSSENNIEHQSKRSYCSLM
ncbi:hypothetical protein Anas_03531 [Armadillidium nasatum]|uniref:Uncharacterized protein n=1 Tax=Armadillidium nasatum TaxID=96803 RepID=A0A5N5SVY7_9CRUS|nr:hypothetical protein Anas_03531 [Armadillidium nasatum]